MCWIKIMFQKFKKKKSVIETSNKKKVLSISFFVSIFVKTVKPLTIVTPKFDMLTSLVRFATNYFA